MRLILFISLLLLIVCLKNLADAALTQCDFNNDGYADLAIGIPDEDVNGNEDAGAVAVLFGRAGGLSATNNQFWTKDSPKVLGASAPRDLFGSSLACGDFNGDGLDDLAIGAPNTVVGGNQFAGSVSILYGSTRWRILAGNNQLWTQNSPSILDVAETNDAFGASVAAGDFNGDGYEDVAIGAPGEVLTFEVRGAVHVLLGSQTGLAAAGNQLWSQQSPGMDNDIQPGEGFGQSLLAANFGRDTSSDCFDDLIIGSPQEVVNGVHAGAIRLLFGSATGLSTTLLQFWSEETPGVPGEAAEGDFFGHILAPAFFTQHTSACGATVADVVLSAPNKTINNVRFSGAVFVIYGNPGGLDDFGLQMWSQASSGIAEDPELDDGFGLALAAGHTNFGDYLAIGASGENVGNFDAAGIVHLLFADPFTGMLTANGSRVYNQNTPGIKDTAERGDVFGSSLSSADFNADNQDDLTIGAIGETLNGVPGAGAIHILPAADTAFTQYFHQNSVDMKDVEEAGDIFGRVFAK